MPAPAQPKIYHIVHVRNLASIVADGYLWSDSVMRAREGGTVIGMGAIKNRRLSLQVSCHGGLRVGDCVPFYFCPRSVMLYVLHCANNPELTYREGQESIVHLEADLHRVVHWADANRRLWAFTLSNAGALYTEFRSSVGHLDEIDWNALTTNDFRSPEIKEGKQAEFLLQQSFPWHLVERVGVHSARIVPRVAAAVQAAAHRPRIEIRREWYF